jgi:hypothetical protein
MYTSRSSDTDRVTLSPELVITSQTIGAASTSTGVDPADGILGFVLVAVTNTLTQAFSFSLGPVGLTTFYSPTKIPTVTDNLFTQRTISTESIGVYFAPFTDRSLHSSSFDGVFCANVNFDSSKWLGWGIELRRSVSVIFPAFDVVD